MFDIPASDAQAEQPTVVNVTEGIYCRQEIDNLTWMDFGEYLLAVDALEHTAKADAVFDAIAETSGPKPVRYLLNTHTHYDHVALNDLFVRKWGTEIINARTREIPERGIWLEGAGRRAHMLPMPDAHTDEDCIVWVPQDRVLLVGDIFGWGLIPLTRNVRSDSFAHLVEVYQRLADYQPEHVIPGHGPLCGRAELQRFVEYLHWLKNECLQAAAENLSDEQAAERIPPPADMAHWWRFVAWKHNDSLGKMLKAARNGWL